MPLTTQGLNYCLDSLTSGTKIVYAALYTDDAATTEVTGGTYARVACTWAAATGGVKTMNGTDPVINVPAATTVKSVGFCASGTGGTGDCYAYHNVTDETFASAGTYTITDASITLT